jgi:hypothetical protein
MVDAVHCTSQAQIVAAACLGMYKEPAESGKAAASALRSASYKCARERCLAEGADEGAAPPGAERVARKNCRNGHGARL